jgi:flagellar P-ring protein precursor FlgI
VTHADLAGAEPGAQVHTPAKIVINERTGTIVMGGDVKLSPVSVIHGNLSIQVVTSYDVAGVLPVGPVGANTDQER